MKHVLTASLFMILFLSSCKESKPLVEDKTIDIVLSDKNREMMSQFFDAFQERYPDYSLNLRVLDDEKTDYYLRHDRLEGEIVILDDLHFVRENSSRFLKLTTSDYFFRYSRYIQNFLSAEDQEMYCLPSPGSFYCYCVNDDLVSSLNQTFPLDVDEMLDFTLSVSNYVRPLSSFNVPCTEYLDLFLQLSIGPLFSTTQGFDMFRDYRFSEGSLYDSEYFNQFVGVLKRYSAIAKAQNNIARIDAFSSFLNQDTCMISMNMDFEFDRLFKESGADFNYSFHPYLGSSEGNEILATSSDFFVSVLEKGYQAASKKSIDSFLDFFTSKEGQSYLVMDKEGNRKTNRLSYLKDSDIRLEGKLSDLQQYLDRGNVFILDDFISSFRISEEHFERFYHDEIGYVTLVKNLDEEMHNYHLIEKNNYVLESMKMLSEDHETQKKELLTLLYCELRKKSSIDCMIVSKSFQKLPTFDGVIYEKDMDDMFDGTCSIVPLYLDGLKLKNFLSDLDDQTYRSQYLSFGSFSKEDDLVFDTEKIQNDLPYLIFVSDDIYKDKQIEGAKVGKSVTVLELFREAFLDKGGSK